MFILFPAVTFAVTSFAQNWPTYNNKTELTGSRKNKDMGSGYAYPENNISVSTYGGYGRLGYSAGYNWKAKTIDLAVGYAYMRENDYGTSTLFLIAPKARIAPTNTVNPQRTKAVSLGALGILNVENPESYEIEVKLSYVGKLKNSSTEWNESLCNIDGEFIKRIGSVVGFGIHFGYEGSIMSEPRPKDAQQQQNYMQQVSTKGTTDLGFIVNAKYKLFQLSVMPEISRDKYSFRQAGQAKVYSATDWYLNWSVSLIYHVTYFKKRR